MQGFFISINRSFPVTLVRNSLDEKVFAELFARGRKMKLEEAVKMALTETSIGEQNGGKQFTNKRYDADLIQQINIE